MKVIIDPYRGGRDVGSNIDGQYEKNLLLNLSKYMSQKLTQLGIENELVRNSDISLTDDERNSIINELKETNDLIIQNRLSDDNEFDIIYSLRNSDSLSSFITKNLESRGINVDKYYQRRLPTNTTLDYYSLIRNTNPNEAIIIEYLDLDNYQTTVDIIATSIAQYINKKNTYIVQKGDSLYKIANKYNTTVDTLKQLNNLTTNNLSIGDILKLPEPKIDTDTKNTYIVQKGDSLYKIANKYNTTVDTLKQLNNLTTNNLSIGDILKLPEPKIDTDTKNIYIVQKGDSLYKIANKYNTTVDTLKQLNNLTTNNLSIGGILKLPNTNNEYIIYTIKKGDSLYQIAKEYNTTVNKIKNINNLTSNLLNIGQKIKIPK